MNPYNDLYNKLNQIPPKPIENKLNELDVSKYTDRELLNILSLTSPTDRELEARIIQMIHKYNSAAGATAEKYQKFFKDVYDRFFDVESDDEEEEEEEEDDDTPEHVIEGMETAIEKDATTTVQVAEEPTVINAPNRPEEQPPTRINDRVSLTKPLEYSRDQLNPLLKQVIRRTVSIDSQFRNRDFYDLPTNFTFNLSEPLRDVVSLKLYSIQIPYTWYTVNNSYGGNFIYVKGNSPGIDDGNYDYFINIKSGNYTQTDLITAINGSINTIMSQRLDVSFGLGNFFSYNQSTTFTSANIYINNSFSEADYILNFTNPGYVNNIYVAPGETTVNYVDRYGYGNITAKLNSFLGFNNASYTMNRVYSSRNIHPGPLYDNESIYAIDTSNNIIRIVQYSNKNTNYYTSDNSMNEFSLVLTPGRYTELSLYNHVNSVISANPYLDTTVSGLRKIEITDISMANYGYAYFELTIRLIRNSPQFISGNPNIKTVVIFPNDTNIWIGSSSFFTFKNTVNELNLLQAETDSFESDFYTNNSQYFLLQCIRDGYTNTNSNIAQYKDLSYNVTNLPVFKNDVKVAMDFNNAISLTTFLQNINNSILNVNTVTRSLNQNDAFGVFNQSTTYASVDNINTFHLSIDLNNVFKNPSYVVSFNPIVLSGAFADLSGSDPTGNIYLNTYSDTSTTNISSITSKLDVLDGTSFIIQDPDNLGNPIRFLTIYPNPTKNNANDISWNIYVYSSANGDNTALNIQTAITSFIPANTTQSPLKNSTVTYNKQNYTFTVNVSINNVLTEVDYRLIFYDGTDSAKWSQVKIYSNTVYNLQTNTSFTDISGYDTISGQDFHLLEDTSFTLSPLYAAVANENIVTVNIPAAVYTRTNLLSLINEQLNANPISYGSLMSVYVDTISNKEYIQFKVNLSKEYTAKDYRLVFYDIVSFVKCYVGTTSVRNTSWDSTLGWILGFRNTDYDLSNYVSGGSSAFLISETSLNVFPYKYFYIILDDYNQSRLNDGLVTLSMSENVIAQPSYAPVQKFVCDPVTGQKVFIGSDSQPLTANQIYAANQIYLDSKVKQSSFSNSPSVKDVFGIIPIKPGTAGSSYVEFGGTLQNQDRLYFGPVNIYRMSIQLVNDRGDIVDLNGSEWSFSFICEQLYRSDAGSTSGK
jgi:hypothetical protein